MEAVEHRRTFPCFGTTCSVFIGEDEGSPGTAAKAAEVGERLLRSWHARFTRFDPASELSRLNADPRWVVPVSPLLAQLAQLAVEAARRTGGLVDATVAGELERVGYARSFDGPPLDLAAALAAAPPRRAARGDPARRWAGIVVDRTAGTVARPPGVLLDSGGLGKGLFADELGGMLGSALSFVVDCGGDLLLGGRDPEPRPVRIPSPFDGRLLHELVVTRGAVATSGIGRRSWTGAEGRPAHHLLDPSTGRPAFTGVVQVTAQAPTASRAEICATGAVLGGPDTLAEHLPFGGHAVLDDGTSVVVAPRDGVDDADRGRASDAGGPIPVGERR